MLLVAPTDRMFFATPGAETDAITSPSFPAANSTSISGLWNMKSSTSWAGPPYWPVAYGGSCGYAGNALPHELECRRAPSSKAGCSMSSSSASGTLNPDSSVSFKSKKWSLARGAIPSLALFAPRLHPATVPATCVPWPSSPSMKSVSGCTL